MVMSFSLIGAFMGAFALLLALPEFANGQDFSDAISSLSDLDQEDLDSSACASGVTTCVNQLQSSVTQFTSTGEACGIANTYLRCLYSIDGCPLDPYADQINRNVENQLSALGVSCGDLYHPDNGQASVQLSGMLLLTLLLAVTSYISWF